MDASLLGAVVEIRPFGHLGSNSLREDTVWWVV